MCNKLLVLKYQTDINDAKGCTVYSIFGVSQLFSKIEGFGLRKWESFFERNCLD